MWFCAIVCTLAAFFKERFFNGREAPNLKRISGIISGCQVMDNSTVTKSLRVSLPEMGLSYDRIPRFRVGRLSMQLLAVRAAHKSGRF